MKYMVNNKDKPHNTPFYSTHSDLDSFILYNEDEVTQIEKENEQEISAPKHLDLSPSQTLDTSTPSNPEQHKTNENQKGANSKGRIIKVLIRIQN